ncbi:MAG: SRPBCC family protein [Candidatus Limnocylindria bacterium]
MPTTNSSEMQITRRGDLEIVITRELDAPRDLVLSAITDPALIPNWWGPRRYTTTVDKMDVRAGGAWRFINSGPDGEHGFRGEYREIVPPEKIVQTFEWEGLPGHISVETLTLEEVSGKTRMTATSVFDTKEDRDGMWETGAETGARETWDRFAEQLEALQRKTKA